MDDYTWQKLIENRRERRQREILFVALMFAVLLGTGIWYFFIYTRTPEYAVDAAIDAIETRDAEKFRRYVNMELLTMRAYDDLTVDFFTNDPTLTSQTRSLFEKFYVLIKPQLVAGVIDTVTGKIAGGEFSLPGGTSLLKGRQLGIDYEVFLEKSRVTSFELVSVGNFERGNGVASAELNIRDTTVNVDFPLVVILDETKDGWQISYINNYRNFLDKVTPLIAKDITAYVAATRDIVSEHNDIFARQRQEFTVLTDTFDGNLSGDRRTFIIDLVENQIIPTLKIRQQKLDGVAVPPGAKYLASQRKKSTELSLQSWQQYLTALKENRRENFETAESLLKQVSETEVRIEDIIKQAALSSELPVVP